MKKAVLRQSHSDSLEFLHSLQVKDKPEPIIWDEAEIGFLAPELVEKKLAAGVKLLIGEISRLVVSVPEIWQRDIYNLGRERLQKLIQELGLPLIQLVSEPVAAHQLLCLGNSSAFSRGKRYKKSLPEPLKLPKYSQSARYRVGMRVNLSQVAYLVIEEATSLERVEYELGNIIAKMFPGFVLSEDAEKDSIL